MLFGPKGSVCSYLPAGDGGETITIHNKSLIKNGIFWPIITLWYGGAVFYCFQCSAESRTIRLFPEVFCVNLFSFFNAFTYSSHRRNIIYSLCLSLNYTSFTRLSTVPEAGTIGLNEYLYMSDDVWLQSVCYSGIDMSISSINMISPAAMGLLFKGNLMWLKSWNVSVS